MKGNLHRLAAGTLAIAGIAAITACGSKKISLNQVTEEARYTIERETKDGTIESIKSKTANGVVYYKVEFERAKQDFDMQVGEDGTLISKELD